MSRMVRIGIIAACTVTGCGKKDAARSAAPVAAIDAAAVNALVPAALKDKLVFERREATVSGHHPVKYTMAAPKSWSAEASMLTTFKGDDFAGISTIRVSSNCDGECKPKDWVKVADKATFSEAAMGAQVISDDAKPGRRTKIASDGSMIHVAVAWWQDGDDKYRICRADLSEAVKDAAPAFAKACQAVAIDGED